MEKKAKKSYERKKYDKKSLSTVYQPIVQVDTRGIIGYEALTRGVGKWHLPEEIFRLSYEEGNTVELDLDCLKRTFRILPKLKKKALLFVNVEPITLMMAFLKGQTGYALLKQYADYSDQVVIELTEGMKTKNFDLIKQGVQCIRKLGYKFALDDIADIGIKLLKVISLKPDFIKIDRRLMKDIARSHFHQSIVRQLISLANQSRSLVIAEGIEQKKDLEFVRKIGIRYVQGFYFSHPRKQLLNAIQRR